MAEFVETMRKIRELCKEREDCAGCIMMNDIACGHALDAAARTAEGGTP